MRDLFTWPWSVITWIPRYSSQSRLHISLPNKQGNAPSSPLRFYPTNRKLNARKNNEEVNEPIST
eukprot:3061899-Amphidinium_carterae.1